MQDKFQKQIHILRGEFKKYRLNTYNMYTMDVISEEEHTEIQNRLKSHYNELIDFVDKERKEYYDIK